jgi:hypothetical protein
MSKFLVLAALFSVNASAAVTGSSSLSIFPDWGSLGFLDIREENDLFLGNYSYDSTGIFRLEKRTHGLKGYADNGFVDITCTAGKCTGVVGSDTINIRYTLNGDVLELEGALNHVYVKATFSSNEIEIYADGAMNLKLQSNGTFEGRGTLNRDPRSGFHGSLSVNGSLVSRLTDPAFVITAWVSPFVRD